MRSPNGKVARIAVAAATPVAILVASALILQYSHAAFSSSSRNSGNDWATGSVALTDDDAGSARFQVSNMLPGDTDTRCLKVTANASRPGVVRAYSLNPVLSSQGLQDHVTFQVNYGTGGGFGSCTGFVSEGVAVPTISLATLATINDWSSAAGADWNVGPGTESRTYQVTWTFDTTGLTQSEVNALQGTHTGIDVQWELQSN